MSRPTKNSCPVCCAVKAKKCRINIRLIRELLRQVPYLIPRYFT